MYLYKIEFINFTDNKYLKKYADNKALCGNSPQNPPHEGSTAGSCVSAIVSSNFLYINKYELAFNPGVMVGLRILAAERLDLYEWS